MTSSVRNNPSDIALPEPVCVPVPVVDENMPAVDLSPHPAQEEPQASLAQVLPSPVTPIQGTPYIDRDTSDTSTDSEDDSLVEHRPEVVMNLDTLQVGQSTHTPTRRTRQCPLVPFLDSTMEQAGAELCQARMQPGWLSHLVFLQVCLNVRLSIF